MSGTTGSAPPRRWQWCLIAGGLLLPVLSHVGYGPLSTEFLAMAVAAIALGLAVDLAARTWHRSPELIAVLVGMNSLVYLGIKVLPPLVAVAIALGFGAVAFAWARRNLGVTMHVLALMFAAQVVLAAALAPQAITLVRETRKPPIDRAAVIHILLDEATGLAAYPRDAVAEGDVAKLAESLVSRGFMVFSRAYSADTKTQFALARMFNKSSENPGSVLTDAGNWHLHRAPALDEIGRDMALDLTFTTYVDLRSALKTNHNVIREVVYDGGLPAASLVRNGASMSDRAQVAAGLSWNWLRVGGSPIVAAADAHTSFGKSITASVHPLWRTHPLVSLDLLTDLEKRLTCCLERGTYVFAHVLLPHYPFVFDARCRLYPASQWLNGNVHQYGATDTLESRRERYRRMFEQATCANSHITSLADRVLARPKMGDTVVLVHGDHGSRITIENRKGVDAAAYSDADYERDNRGTFLAVRMPGLAPGIVERPVRVDDVYTALVHSGFAKLNVDAMPRRADSPY